MPTRNSRAFLEELLTKAGDVPPGSGTRRAHQALDSLHAQGVLVDGEETFTKALWKLLYANGSHPGLSDQDESRFRLLTLTGTRAAYLLASDMVHGAMSAVAESGVSRGARTVEPFVRELEPYLVTIFERLARRDLGLKLGLRTVRDARHRTVTIASPATVPNGDSSIK